MTFHLNEYGRRVERSQKVSLINAVFDVAERNKWLGMTWKPPSYCSSQNASSKRRLLVMLHTTFYELALRKNLLFLLFFSSQIGWSQNVHAAAPGTQQSAKQSHQVVWLPMAHSEIIWWGKSRQLLTRWLFISSIYSCKLCNKKQMPKP